MGNRKVPLKVEYDEEKIRAINNYLKGKESNLESEIVKYLDGFYKKRVPKQVQEFIESASES